MISNNRKGGISLNDLKPRRIISEGICPRANTRADEKDTIQKIWFCHFSFKIIEEISHTRNGIKNSRNIISSPIPAIAEATRDVGKGGCGSLANG